MTNTTNHRFTVINCNDRRNYQFEVHAHGCADCRRGQNRMRDSYPLSGPSAHEAVAEDIADYDSQDQGWSWQDYRIMPCAEAVTPATPAPTAGEELVAWLIG